MGFFQDRRHSRAMRLRPAAFSLTFLGAMLIGSAPAQAGLLKCRAPDGTVTYTDTSCPPGTSNQDVPPEFSSRAPSGAATHGADKPLSTAALVFKDKMENCLKTESSADCRPLDVAAEICNDKVNSRTSQCIAFWEAVDATRALALGMDPRRMSDARAACAGGDESACIQVACPPNIYNEGSDEQVRACAYRTKTAASTHWLQFDERRYGQSSSTTFLCMKKQEMVTSWGLKQTFRPQVVVISQVPPVGLRAVHKVSSVADEEFATAGEAATAGCAAEAEKLGKRDSKKASARKAGGAI